MKIAVLCANGKAGQFIVKEALSRDLDVTAVVRGENRTQAKRAIIKDFFDLTLEDLKDFDVVINAFGAWTAELLSLHTKGTKLLCDLLSNTNIRLFFVGGAGSLYVNPEHTQTVSQDPNFPDAYKPIASAMAQALAYLRTRSDVKWTYLSPASDFQPEGKRSGKYTLGGEELIVNQKGESIISYADYAIAMIDEVIVGKHIQERISVVGE